MEFIMEFDQKLFDNVIKAAKSFETSLNTRPVTPNEDAIRALNQFDEPFINSGMDAKDVIKMLVEIGEQGVVSTRGGRYFGFVTGSALPVSIAANWMASK
jgi:hypothetical protein